MSGEAGLWDEINGKFHGKTRDSTGTVRYGGPIKITDAAVVRNTPAAMVIYMR